MRIENLNVNLFSYNSRGPCAVVLCTYMYVQLGAVLYIVLECTYMMRHEWLWSCMLQKWTFGTAGWCLCESRWGVCCKDCFELHVEAFPFHLMIFWFISKLLVPRVDGRITRILYQSAQPFLVNHTIAYLFIFLFAESRHSYINM